MTNISGDLQLNSYDGGYDIVYNREEVGYIEISENLLTQIEVYKPYRKNGYAKESIILLMQKLQSNYDYIETTSVVSPILAHHVLEPLGFNQRTDEPSHYFKKLE